MAQKGNLSAFLNSQANALGENQEEKDGNLDWLDSGNERLRNGNRNLLKRNPPDYLNNDFANEDLLNGNLK